MKDGGEAARTEALETLRALRPRSVRGLADFVELVMGVRPVPRAMLAEHDAPLAYLAHSFFEPGMEGFVAGPRDCVVWASRGSGKTHSAAVATALDLLFKPGIDIRLLAGSLEQGQRMNEHLRALFERQSLADLVARKTERTLSLINGSHATLLSASHASVRGTRPQILRCDEVDVFHEDVWRAAQLTTRSKTCGDVHVTGRVEALSTWHEPAGIMASLIAESSDNPAGDAPKRLFKWSVLDVLERCAPERSCEACSLWDECRGGAKEFEAPGGHMPIDDAIVLKRRTDASTWAAEMLCERPVVRDAIYDGFDPGTHVFDHADHISDKTSNKAMVIAGMDFGYRSPAAVLIASVDHEGVLRIHEERIERESTVSAHAAWLSERKPIWIGADPAGHQRSEITGTSAIGELRSKGLRVRARRMSVDAGIRLVRARLTPASGEPRLFISSACEGLITSLISYRTDRSGTPIKDGSDHAVDALRYMIVNLDKPWTEKHEAYW